MNILPPPTPQNLRIKLFERDPKQPIDPRGNGSTNPRYVETLQIPWVDTVDGRAAAAREAVTKHTGGRVPGINHGTEGGQPIIVAVVVKAG